MTASTQMKGLLAGLAAVAIAGSAFAQGTPPNPAVKDPATGAGQQSTQTTPMGSTGTPTTGAGAASTGSTGGSTAATGSTGGSTAATGSSSTAGSTGSSSTMGASGSSTMPADTTAAPSTTRRTARADRN